MVISLSERIIRARPGTVGNAVAAGEGSTGTRRPAPGDAESLTPGDTRRQAPGQVLRGRSLRLAVDGHVDAGAGPVPPTLTLVQDGGQNADAVASVERTGGPAAAGATPVAAPAPDQLARVVAAAEARGYAQGQARAAEELRAQLAAAAELAAQLDASAPQEVSVVARLVIDLSLAVARHVLDRQVNAEPAVLVGVIERALRGINGSPEVRVFLHPDTLEPVRAAWEASHGDAYLGKRWTFTADPRLPLGGCTIRQEHGFVEAGTDVQLEEIRQALERAVPLRPQSGSSRRAEDAA